MSEKKNRDGLKRYLSALRHALKHLFLHNGWLKLIAVLISVILWAGLISQDETITRDKTFQNVPVTVTGQETLKNNAYIVVSDLDEMLDNLTAIMEENLPNGIVDSYE